MTAFEEKMPDHRHCVGGGFYRSGGDGPLHAAGNASSELPRFGYD